MFCVEFDQFHAVLFVRTESTKRFEMETKIGVVMRRSDWLWMMFGAVLTSSLYT
jgi:hypothetical protein